MGDDITSLMKFPKSYSKELINLLICTYEMMNILSQPTQGLFYEKADIYLNICHET